MENWKPKHKEIIESLAMMKTNACSARDKIRDLYDVTYIVNTYFNELSKPCKILIADALSYKGIEQFDYLARTQEDGLIDINELAEKFLQLARKAPML